MWAAIGSGFWAQVFWLRVVGIGMLLPQLLALDPGHCGKTAIWCWSAARPWWGSCCCLLLLYVGQMTVV